MKEIEERLKKGEEREGEGERKRGKERRKREGEKQRKCVRRPCSGQDKWLSERKISEISQ